MTFELTEARQILAGTPASLQAQLSGLSDGWLWTDEGEGTCFLTGRRTFLGYIGHLWSHGLDYHAREAEMKRIYEGAPDAASLIGHRGIDYVVVGPREREAARSPSGPRLNESFFQRYTKVGEAGEYRLYKTRP